MPESLLLKKINNLEYNFEASLKGGKEVEQGIQQWTLSPSGSHTGTVVHGLILWLSEPGWLCQSKFPSLCWPFGLADPKWCKRSKIIGLSIKWIS